MTVIEQIRFDYFKQKAFNLFTIVQDRADKLWNLKQNGSFWKLLYLTLETQSKIFRVVCKILENSAVYDEFCNSQHNFLYKYNSFLRLGIFSFVC